MAGSRKYERPGLLNAVCDPFRVEMHNAPFNALRANICDPYRGLNPRRYWPDLEGVTEE